MMGLLEISFVVVCLGFLGIWFLLQRSLTYTLRRETQLALTLAFMVEAKMITKANRDEICSAINIPIIEFDELEKDYLQGEVIS